MSSRNELIQQTNLAFDFVQKLYLETSYFVKEVEGLLKEEAEEFIIGRPAGYGISTKSSTGLESDNIPFWLIRAFSVFFIPKRMTTTMQGLTQTEFSDELKVLYLRIVFSNKEIEEPIVYMGILYNIVKKPQGDRFIKKYERLMNYLETNSEKIFKDPRRIEFEDSYIKIKGELLKNNLYEINDSETISKKVIGPALKLFRKG